MRALPLVLLLTGCSSVTPIAGNEWVLDYGEGCTVTVYQTEAQARAVGEIVELCVIEGTSSMSFKHTPETAIRKHAKKACGCGADKVYVASRSPMGIDVATASMVAFRWASE